MSFFKKLKNKVLGKKDTDEVLEKIQESRNLLSQEKYEKGLQLSKDSLFKKLKLFLARNRQVDKQFFDEFEEILIMADVGYDYTKELSNYIQKEIKLRNLTDTDQILDLILEEMHDLYIHNLDQNSEKLNIEKGRLNVILVSGVNGVGKTTSIGKLIFYLKNKGYSVIIAAADTFRAGAVEQLKIWAERTNIEIVSPLKVGQDPASVVYSAIVKAKENKTDVLIIDTAGRLQNKQNLMNEIAKLKKVIEKESGGLISETLLVIDATTGQNGVLQAKVFNEILNISGIILTKMDSSSKGGIILSIKDVLNIPVKFIGLGEAIEDLEEFDINKYLYGLTKDLFEVKDENI